MTTSDRYFPREAGVEMDAAEAVAVVAGVEGAGIDSNITTIARPASPRPAPGSAVAAPVAYYRALQSSLRALLSGSAPIEGACLSGTADGGGAIQGLAWCLG